MVRSCDLSPSCDIHQPSGKVGDVLPRIATSINSLPNELLVKIFDCYRLDDEYGMGIQLEATYPVQPYKTHNHNPPTFNSDPSHHQFRILSRRSVEAITPCSQKGVVSEAPALRPYVRHLY